MNVTFTNPAAFFAVWAVVGFVFALICGTVAKARGHDQTSWMVLGFFLGLIALLVLAVLPEGEVGRKSCPDCVSPVVERARVCKHCGYRFTPSSG